MNNEAESEPGKDLLSVDYYRDVWQEERKHNRTLRDEVMGLKKELAYARYLVEHLFAMVPRQAWRDTGGDDGQGHYEGEYAAARLEEEIQSWKKEM
jgi:hypothetical protein